MLAQDQACDAVALLVELLSRAAVGLLDGLSPGAWVEALLDRMERPQ